MNKALSQQKEKMTKIRAKRNKIDTKKNLAKTNGTKSWFFKKIKIDEPLARLTHTQKRTQIN